MEILENSALAKSVNDFPFKGPVFEVSPDQTVNYAFTALGEKGYLSAPIWDAKTKTYWGFFDVSNALTMLYTVDLMASILPSSWVDQNAALKMLTSSTKDQLKIKDLIIPDDEDAFETTEGGILDTKAFGIQRIWKPVTEDANMTDVLKRLADHAKRVAVVSKSQPHRVVKLITASQVTKVLDDALKAVEAKYDADDDDYEKHIPKIFSLAPKDIKNFKPVEKKIFSVKATDKVSTAFLTILENNISAVAVVDEEGMLLSSISNTDVRMFKSLEEVISERVLSNEFEEDIVQDNIDEKSGKSKSLMDYSCEDFVKLVREEFETKKATKIPYISVADDCSLRRIISKLAFTKKHRVWITDNQKRVVNVVSVSDIAQVILTALGEN